MFFRDIMKKWQLHKCCNYAFKRSLIMTNRWISTIPKSLLLVTFSRQVPRLTLLKDCLLSSGVYLSRILAVGIPASQPLWRAYSCYRKCWSTEAGVYWKILALFFLYNSVSVLPWHGPSVRSCEQVCLQYLKGCSYWANKGPGCWFHWTRHQMQLRMSW